MLAINKMMTEGGRKKERRLHTATDGSSAGADHVDVVLFSQSLDLCGSQAGVGEHAIL